MNKFTYINNSNPLFVDAMFKKFKENPDSIDLSWKMFFQGYEFAEQSSQFVSGDGASGLSDKEVSVVKLIHGYRSRGHLISTTNPIRQRRTHKSDLELGYFGLSSDDLDTEFDSGSEVKIGRAPLKSILEHLQKTYCGNIGVEFMYCRNENLRQWLYERMEKNANSPEYSNEVKRHILKKISQGVLFESFLQKKYVGKKRFSLEGLEAFIPSLDTAINVAANLGTEEVVMAMAHRGRLNVLVNIFEKSYETIFSEFEDFHINETYERGGDVKYHLGKSADIKTVDGKPVHLSLLFNPSHLEAVGPVLQGIVHSKGHEEFGSDFKKILPIVVHGDAAISGQGVNYELANLSELDGFGVGGSIHIVLNNQVGFTANYKESRSSVYCTDLAKVTESPVFHVNADDPLSVVHAMTMAVEIRQKFGIDVYVDILGYRRYGHNEGDEPRFTQPKLYQSISKHNNVYKLFLNQLVENQDIGVDEAKLIEKSFNDLLQDKLQLAKEDKVKMQFETLGSYWKGLRLAEQKDFEKSIATQFSLKHLDSIANALTSIPEQYQLFSKMKKLINHRLDLYFKQKKVDWALAELLAYGSLLIQGHSVRLSGQDSQRGTFSHRHSVIKDVETENSYIPLNHIAKNQALFSVYNSMLSEYCLLGFEYGYSLASPFSLVVWEAQFGDFANGAQIIIDQFISSSEYKWQRMSGLVLLLPHGYEGQGPEHSSARFERFLQLCAEENMYVVNITTPANFFHVLRRQVKNEFRKPLVVMSPKSLLRHPKVMSSLSELAKSGFQEIIDDTLSNIKQVKKVLLCTGKVYYDLLDFRDQHKIKDIAIIRFEQLYPLSQKQLNALRLKYKHVKQWCWVQEEPENMGAWTYILRALRNWDLDVVARLESASPATGSSKSHDKSLKDLLERAFTKKSKKNK
ncbi:2-oxoglutarate dehydrogenase E1 component [Candidatus Marinamargulisbacteria bacterium SCGC AG-410-N11]|nr:2-oxoglutarate dehydrogenase E1 component [Candidatus Marinamargulisbacteria bacterium SCGC AG-410-N11]